jgi:integrase/recombinase XerD
MANFTTSIILETRTPRKDGTVPVKLRLIIDRKSRYYHLGIYLTPDQFERIMNPKPKAKPRDKDKQLRQKLIKTEAKANGLLAKMENPDFEQFRRLFTFKGGGGNVLKYYEAYIQECKQENRLGTASSYECSKNSLDNIKGIENANFRDITPAWLKDYQAKMEALGKSNSTVGIYLRPLRFLFRKAINDGVISENQYPFLKYQIPTSENNKRPLERSELEALANYTGNPNREMYRDFFLLSYYLVGLNFMDLLTLKWKQYSGDRISLVRTKTKRTTQKKQTPISLFVNDDAQEIIKRYGNPGATYIFNVITENDNPSEIRRKVQNFNRNTNQALKAIAKKTPGINPNISTVFARHSAASHGIDEGANLADVSKALGHKNIQTTSNYISGLSEGAKLLGNSLKIKATVPKMERGTKGAQTPTSKGIEAVPVSVPLERFSEQNMN